MLSTLKEHEGVLRLRCHNGRLYRNDAKLSDWLGIPPDQIQQALDSLVIAGVLLPQGTSSKGSETYTFGVPTGLSDDARRLYRVMLALTTAEGVVNAANAGELAEAAGMEECSTRFAFMELRRAGLVDEKTLGHRRFPLILHRFELV